MLAMSSSALSCTRYYATRIQTSIVSRQMRTWTVAEYTLQENLTVILKTASWSGCQSAKLREEEEQEVPLSATQPPYPQQEQAELQIASPVLGDEEEGTSSISDNSVDNTKTVRDKQDIDIDTGPTAQPISQKFEVSRQGSVLQPVQPSLSYFNPEKVIQQLESAVCALKQSK